MQVVMGLEICELVPLEFILNTTSNKWEAEITIETKDDNQMDDPNGVISVVLIDQSGYDIGTDPNDRITINVKDLTVPTITIADAPDITPTQMAQFTLTADTQPWQALAIRFTPTETGSNFLDPTGGASGSERITDPAITFTAQSGGSTPITGTLSIPTIADNANTRGTINIELLGDSNATDPSYMIAGDATANTKTVIVRTIAEITISNAPETIAGEEAVFTLTSNIAITQPISIIIKPSNERGTFLDETNGASGNDRTIPNVTFSSSAPGQPFTYSLEIPTKFVDVESQTSGVIEVELVDESTTNDYSISDTEEEKIATVNILNGIHAPTLSISRISEEVVNENTTSSVGFTISLDKPLEFPIKINYAISEYQGTEIQAIEGSDFTFTGGSIDFAAGVTSNSEPITATIIDDDIFEPDEIFNVGIAIAGFSQITLSQPASVTIISNETQEKPFVYVTTEQQSVPEGDSAEFRVNVKRPENNPDLRNAPVTVDLKVTEMGSFIAWRYPRQITIPMGEIDASVPISISTSDDSTNEPDGEIKLSIERNDSIYTIDEASVFAIVEVLDNDERTIDETELPRISVADSAVNSILTQLSDLLGGVPRKPTSNCSNPRPTISVNALKTNINEGEDAEFDLITSDNLTENLVVSFVMNQSGDFLTEDTPSQAQIHRLTNQSKSHYNYSG